MNHMNPLKNASGATVAAHSVARRRGVMISVRSDASASDDLSARRSGVSDAICASTVCARSGHLDAVAPWAPADATSRATSRSSDGDSSPPPAFAPPVAPSGNGRIMARPSPVTST